MFEVWAGGTSVRITMPRGGRCGARQAAEKSGGAAYADAVPGCAALERDELRAAARRLLTRPSPATSGRG